MASIMSTILIPQSILECLSRLSSWAGNHLADQSSAELKSSGRVLSLGSQLSQLENNVSESVRIGRVVAQLPAVARACADIASTVERADPEFVNDESYRKALKDLQAVHAWMEAVWDHSQKSDKPSVNPIDDETIRYLSNDLETLGAILQSYGFRKEKTILPVGTPRSSERNGLGSGKSQTSFGGRVGDILFERDMDRDDDPPRRG